VKGVLIIGGLALVAWYVLRPKKADAQPIVGDAGPSSGMLTDDQSGPRLPYDSSGGWGPIDGSDAVSAKVPDWDAGWTEGVGSAGYGWRSESQLVRDEGGGTGSP
jgi:hypothetical protein